MKVVRYDVRIVRKCLLRRKTFTELHSEQQNPEKVKHDGRFDPLLVGTVSAAVIVFSLTLVITIVVIRRRKTYKRGSSSALSEDSDVRFLTSDEILDFNLARPAENEEP